MGCWCSSSSGIWWNHVMFGKPYSSIVLWIVHLETPQHFSNLNPTESQFTQFFQHLTRNVKTWSSRSFLFLLPWGKRISATVSGVTGLIAMWWFKDDNTCAKASASESSSSLSLVPISRQSLIDLLPTMHLSTPI